MEGDTTECEGDKSVNSFTALFLSVISKKT